MVTDSASSIQACVRGRQSRKNTTDQQLNESITRIQSGIHGNAVRDGIAATIYSDKETAASTLQAALVATVARDVTRESIRETVDIPILQGAIRGKLARIEVANTKEATEAGAALVLQAACLGHRGRQFAAAESKIMKLEAGNVIQSMIQGQSSRSFVEEWLQEEAEFAAGNLQASMRGMMARRALAGQLQQQAAAECIIAALAGATDRENSQAMIEALELHSVISVQAGLTGMRQRRAVDEALAKLNKDAALCVQSALHARETRLDVSQQVIEKDYLQSSRIQAGIKSTAERRDVTQQRQARYTNSAKTLQAAIRARKVRKKVGLESEEYYSSLLPVFHSGLGFFSNIGKAIEKTVQPKSKSAGGWMFQHRRSPSMDAAPAVAQRALEKVRVPWWKRKVDSSKIPCSGRGNAWAKTDSVTQRAVPELYEKLVKRSQVATRPQLAQVREQIEKDSTRTLPEKPCFASDTSPGCVALERMLLAYALQNPIIGYCQGMNFLAAMLLMHVKKEEDAFWCLTVLVEEILEGYFDKDMIQSRVDLLVFKGLIDQHLPAVATHFSNVQFDVSCVSARWFICIYVDCLPEAVVEKVWTFLPREGTSYIRLLL
jgi:hypothetical protein